MAGLISLLSCEQYQLYPIFYLGRPPLFLTRCCCLLLGTAIPTTLHPLPFPHAHEEDTHNNRRSDTLLEEFDSVDSLKLSVGWLHR